MHALGIGFAAGCVAGFKVGEKLYADEKEKRQVYGTAAAVAAVAVVAVVGIKIAQIRG